MQRRTRLRFRRGAAGAQVGNGGKSACASRHTTTSASASSASRRPWGRVEHVASALLDAIVPRLAKQLKVKAADLAPRVRSQLMLFVNCLVDNPEFDAQAKEALTTPPPLMGGAFGASRLCVGGG